MPRTERRTLRCWSRPRAVLVVMLLLSSNAGWAQAAGPQPPDDMEIQRRDASIALRWTAAWNTLVWPAGSTVTGCFFERDARWRQLFVQATRAWMEIANLKFDFGDGPGYRTCSILEASDIRVTFRPGLASFSRAGTLALDVDPGAPTLVITTGALGEQMAQSREARYGVMLHEIGHALGLPHEHQHTLSPCPGEYRFELLCARSEAAGPNAARFLSLATAFNAQRTVRLDLEPDKQPAYDVNSVMHYRYTPDILRSGRSSRCFARTPLSFSLGDRIKAEMLYPKNIASQKAFLLQQAAVLQRTLAASGLSRPTAERLARLIETRVARRHGDFGFRIDLGNAPLNDQDTTDRELELAGRGREAGAATCATPGGRRSRS